MTDIAHAAGVGRVTLYGHFASRDDLFHAAVGHVVGQVQAAFDALDLDQMTSDEALTAMLRASWHMIERHRAFFATATHRHEPALTHHHDLIFQRLGSVIERGRRDGVFRSDQPVTWLVAVCVGLVHAAVMQVESRQMPPGDAVEALITTVRAACRPA